MLEHADMRSLDIVVADADAGGGDGAADDG